jgi:hypothetical protein
LEGLWGAGGVDGGGIAAAGGRHFGENMGGTYDQVVRKDVCWLERREKSETRSFLPSSNRGEVESIATIWHGEVFLFHMNEIRCDIHSSSR